ncbi:SDR family NAD(P)-dependent oxidoreductase [Vibrio agarivorans]|uniref:SDR family NAD(P)-dependent oxidoreductase n=1 Tax=Vibrio agarivorans TaxID=153622 RepID=UPI0025B5768E|nr:SDR family oxidoreductase [Vibrio agarivorans]MDN3662167.1 SDR family oxidoreductase [Vibrio agarivorans]
MNIRSQSQNKIQVLITGGNGDIAKALKAALIVSQDYDIHTPSRTELDVTLIDSVKTYFQKRHFDIVINAAGTLYSARIEESDPELWIKDINVNLIGVYLCCKFTLAQNNETRVINIASTAAYNAYKDWTSYCASKAGVLKLSGGLVHDGYDVVAMCPGAIDTKIRQKLTISNNNVMSIEEGIAPILRAVKGQYESGDIVFYRKGVEQVLKYDTL